MGILDKLRANQTARDASSAEAKDPVCGMSVDPAKAAGTSQHEGKTYHFCSPGCKRTFDADPGRYAKEG